MQRQRTDLLLDLLLSRSSANAEIRQTPKFGRRIGRMFGSVRLWQHVTIRPKFEPATCKSKVRLPTNSATTPRHCNIMEKVNNLQCLCRRACHKEDVNGPRSTRCYISRWWTICVAGVSAWQPSRRVLHQRLQTTAAPQRAWNPWIQARCWQWHNVVRTI